MKTIHAIVALLLASLPGVASACSCIGESLAQQLDRANVVALVRVLETRLHAASLNASIPPDAGPVRAKFERVEALKGDAAKIGELASWYGGGDCGMALLPGLYYLILVDLEERVASVNSCSGTMVFGAFDPRDGPQTIAKLRLNAARNYLRNRKPIDPCLERGFDFERGDEDGCNRKLSQTLSEVSP